MKKHIFNLLLVLLCAAGELPARAQQCFNRRYTLKSVSTILSGTVEANDKFYATSISLDSTYYDLVSGGFFNHWGIRFSAFDAAGNVLQSKLFQLDRKKSIDTWSNNLIALPGNTFLLAANSIDTSVVFGQLNTTSCLIQFDSSGNVLFYRDFERPYCTTYDVTNHLLTDCKPDRHGNWIMLSSVYCKGKVSICLRKLDASFQEQWVKIIRAKDTLDNTPKHLLIEDDGYIICGGLSNGNIKPMSTDFYSSLIFKTDTSGDSVLCWQNKFDTAHLQFTANDILRSKDGGLIYCGSGEGLPEHFAGRTSWSAIRTKGWVEKLDAHGNSVWQTTIGKTRGATFATEQTVLKSLPDGSIVVAGIIAEQYDPTDESKAWLRGCLTKLNGADGGIIWQRTYKSPDGNDTMYLSIYDMRITDDGGFILAGEARNAIDRHTGPIQRGWLVKVDSNGCLGPGDPQCLPTEITSPKLQTAEIHVYPNPAGDYVEVQGAPRTSNFALRDVSGKTLLTTATDNTYPLRRIDISRLPTGIYFYSITDQSKTLLNGKLMKK